MGTRITGWGQHGDTGKRFLVNWEAVAPSPYIYDMKNFMESFDATLPGTPVISYDPRVDELKRVVEEHDKMLTELAQKPVIIPIKIYNLSSEKYELKMPVDVILEIYPDEVLALLPELTLCGEGESELEALEDLKSDIIDLLEDIKGTPDAELGKSPKLWKKTLEWMVEKCQ